MIGLLFLACLLGAFAETNVVADVEESFELHEELELEEGAEVSAFTSDQITKMLSLHNAQRAKYCSPALVWSASIASVAQAYASMSFDPLFPFANVG